MCMHAITMQDYGGLGACSPKKLDALRLLLRPFCDRSRAVVAVYATWLAEYCIQFWLPMYAFAIDVEFQQEKVLRLAEQQVDGRW